jgi:hypothetical protein
MLVLSHKNQVDFRKILELFDKYFISRLYSFWENLFLDVFIVIDKFQKLLKERREDYNTWVPVYCLALREHVFFNAMGFGHLRFKVDGTPRNPKEQMYKLGLLPLVRPTVHNAVTIERYERRLAPFNSKKKDGQKILKEIEYWAIVSTVGKRKSKIKVILRKIGTGKIHFWSVMKLA